MQNGHVGRTPPRNSTMPLSTMLRSLRETLGASQLGWAIMFRVSDRTVGNWESGRRVPRKQVLRHVRERLRYIDSTERMRIAANPDLEVALCDAGILDPLSRKAYQLIAAVVRTTAGSPGR